MPVNAYLVETPAGVVAVDSTLTLSDARALRERAAGLGSAMSTKAHNSHLGRKP
jgi:hypothetical protein